jgi:hypothetical protein
VGLFVWSIPVAYEQLSTVCEGYTGCDFLRLVPEDAKVLKRLGLSVGFYAAYNVALSVVSTLGYWAIGAILFWKSSGHRVALYASVALVTFGTVQADSLHWLAEAYPGLDLPIALVYFVGEASFGVLFCVFPDGRFVPHWTRWAAAAWIIYWLLDSFFPDWPLVISAPLFLCLIGSLVVAQIYRYRRVSGPVERQQTKWVVFGFSAMIAAFGCSPPDQEGLRAHPTRHPAIPNLRIDHHRPLSLCPLDTAVYWRCDPVPPFVGHRPHHQTQSRLRLSFGGADSRVLHHGYAVAIPVLLLHGCGAVPSRHLRLRDRHRRGVPTFAQPHPGRRRQSLRPARRW